MLNLKENANRAAVCDALEELFSKFSAAEAAQRCDEQMSLLMCLEHGEADGNHYSFLKEIRDTFNRIAYSCREAVFVPGADIVE